MSKKKPRSKDPHDWIKDTTKKAASPSAKSAAPAEAVEATAAPDEEEAESESVPGRFVVVEYRKNDGVIVAAQEAKRARELPASPSEDRVVARIVLTEEMRDITLIDLYDNYRVDVSKTKPTFTRKA